MPQQSITHIKIFKISNIHNNPQPLPCFCLIKLIPMMERLETLMLENVTDTSLSQLIVVLPRVPTLRNLLIETSTEDIEMLFPTDNFIPTGTIKGTSNFISQILPQLPQQTVARIGSLTIRPQKKIFHMGSLTIWRSQGDPQPLPHCMLELFPRMGILNSLILKKTVLNATLTRLMPLLSTCPVLRNLTTLHITLGATGVERFFFGTLKSICTCTCTSPETIEQLLQFLPQQHMAQIQIFKVNYYATKPLPHCLSELILKMEKLNTVTLKRVDDASLAELIPALSRVPTLKNLTVSKGMRNMMTSDSCKVTINFSSNSIEAIECQYYTTKHCEQILIQIPQKFIARVKTLIISGTKFMHKEKDKDKDKGEDEEGDESEDEEGDESEDEYVHHSCKLLAAPPCLPELILRMEGLHTLTLENVLDTSLSVLIPVLPRVSTLRNLTLPKPNFENVLLLCQWLPQSQLEKLIFRTKHSLIYPDKIRATFGGNSIQVIECQYCSIEFINQILLQIPQQLIAQVKTLTIYNVQYIVYDYDSDDESISEQRPLPSCLPGLMSRMAKLNTLTLNVLDTSLTELIQVLSEVSTLRNLSLHELNSEGIDLLCQWLSTCQLETLQLPSLSPDQVELVSSSLTTISSLKTLDMQLSKFTSQSMQTFASTLQQNQSLTEVNITRCSLDGDCTCRLAEVLHNTTLRKLDISRNPVGKMGALAMAEMLKHNTTLEELDFSITEISGDGVFEISSDGVVAVYEALSHNTTMKKLSMRENSVDERGALAMAEMLKHNTTLEEFDFSNTAIHNNGVIAMVEAFHDNTTLRKLHMKWNIIGEKEMIAMAEMLKHNTTLEELDFSNAEISSDGAVAMAKALHCNTTMRKLYMKWNPVGQRGMLAMAEMLIHNTTLEELGLMDDTLRNAETSRMCIKALLESLAENQHVKKLILSAHYQKFVTCYLPLLGVPEERVLFEYQNRSF